MNVNAALPPLVERYAALAAAQKADNEAHAEYLARKNARAAEINEIKFTLLQHIATDEAESAVVEVGDRLVACTSKSKVLVSASRLKAYLDESDEATYAGYAARNAEVAERLTIKRKRRARA